MSTADLTAGEVMDSAAALLNDVNKSQYTYAVQVPYLNMALQEMREYYQLNALSITEEATSTPIPVDAGVTKIGFGPGYGTAKLPFDFIEPLQLWERTRNIDPYTPMTRRNFLPHYLEGTETNLLIYWSWQSQEIRVLPAVQDNDIKMDYVRAIIPKVVDKDSLITVINAKTFLDYRTAALIAKLVENNDSRADTLDNDAGIGLDRVLGISSKSKQSIMTRRKPFRLAYKRTMRS